MLVIEQCQNSRAVTIFIRGGNKMVRCLVCVLILAGIELIFVLVAGVMLCSD